MALPVFQAPRLTHRRDPDSSSEHLAKNVLLIPWWFYKRRLGTISVLLACLLPKALQNKAKRRGLSEPYWLTADV